MRVRNFFSPFALCLIVTGALATPGALEAQTPTPTPQQAPAPTPPDQEELEQFATVYVAVSEVQVEMQAEIAGAESAEEASAIQQAAAQQIGQILQSNEFTQERYANIVAILNEDMALRERFEALLQEEVDSRS